MENYSWEKTFTFPWEKYRNIANVVLRYLNDCNVILDVGYGDGYILRRLRRAYPEKKLIGLEIVPKRALDLSHNITALCGSVESMPFESDSIDGVISTFVLDYVDRTKAIGEIRRVLKDNGKAVLFFHHPESDTLSEITKGLENPENAWHSYFAETLASKMFKSNKEFVDFAQDSMKVDSLETYGQKTDNGKTKHMCYVAYLRNKDPVWNFFSEPIIK